MHLKFRAASAAFATTAAAVATGAFLALTGTSAAMAAPAPAAGSVGVQSWQWQGPFGTYASCITVQSEFRRYYPILKGCEYYPSSGFYFAYDNGQ